MKLRIVVLVASLFFSSVNFGQNSDDSVSEEKALMTCTQLGQEDLLQVKLVKRSDQGFIVLTLKDGEIEFLVTIPEKLADFSYALPDWKGETRSLRRKLDFWIVASCGGSVCNETRVNCIY